MIQERPDEIRPAILIVQVIGMLPHIAGEERLLPGRDRSHCVRALHDLELVLLGDQPRPSAPELADRGRLKHILELVEAAEVPVDALRERARRRATAARLHGSPEEGMVPMLSGIVEYRSLGLVLVACG